MWIVLEQVGIDFSLQVARARSASNSSLTHVSGTILMTIWIRHDHITFPGKVPFTPRNFLWLQVVWADCSVGKFHSEVAAKSKANRRHDSEEDLIKFWISVFNSSTVLLKKSEQLFIKGLECSGWEILFHRFVCKYNVSFSSSPFCFFTIWTISLTHCFHCFHKRLVWKLQHKFSLHPLYSYGPVRYFIM